jgi:hypothetical protein
MGGGPVISGDPDWHSETFDSVNTAASGDPPKWEDPGTDSLTALKTAKVATLWSLNTAYPHQHDDLGWSYGRGGYGWNMSVQAGKFADGNFRWSVGFNLTGAREWKFNSTVVNGPYAGHKCGGSYGAQLYLEKFGAVATNKATNGIYGANWINYANPVHPTYEMVNYIEGTPSGAPPASGIIIAAPYYSPLPGSCFWYYTSVDPVACDVDFQDAHSITLNLQTDGQNLRFAAYERVFGLSIPPSITLTFEPNP